MSALTVTEKEHWKERIGRRIDKKIEALLASTPTFLETTQERARERAVKSLGLADWQAELDSIETQKQTLAEREKAVQRQMLAKVQGVPVEAVSDSYCYGGQTRQVNEAVTKRQAVHEDELLAEDELGQQILRLRQEKDNLLDTVWLATSPAHLRTLWQKVSELLGDEQTPLQKEAMVIGIAKEANGETASSSV